MKKMDKVINLKKMYVYVGMLLFIGIIIYSILFLDLFFYFLIVGVIIIGNYFLLECIECYKEIN